MKFTRKIRTKGATEVRQGPVREDPDPGRLERHVPRGHEGLQRGEDEGAEEEQRAARTGARDLDKDTSE